MPIRCKWSLLNEEEKLYHDLEWGVPVHDDKILFEFLLLEGAQAGLSWDIILKRRNNYKIAFDNFDYEKIAMYDVTKFEKLIQNPEIIRNKLKIKSAINNAQCFINLRHKFGSFDAYLWQFVNGIPIQNNFDTIEQIPAYTSLSIRISADLKKKGFTFMGPTITYAFMQAIGMVNDHVINCFRHETCKKMGEDKLVSL